MSMDSSALLLLFFFFLPILVGTNGTTDHSHAWKGCKPREREALLQFKKETTDDKDRMLSSWDEEKEEDCCRWKGVSCHNTTGRILSLQLPGYHLEGNISTSLLQLKFLEYLDLSHNYLNPSAFLVGVGSLKSLRYLNLSYYYGTLGTCKQVLQWSLRNLSRLEVLDLSEVGYGTCSWGSCEWLSNLSSLKYLSMRWANLSEAANLFQALNRMPSLSYLDLSGCNLVQFIPASSTSGLITQHLNFTMLKHLDLSDNSLEFKPPHRIIGNLTSLEYLDLSQNKLLEDPGGFLLRSLRRLKTLTLFLTPISSNLHDFLAGLRHGVVVSLDLSNTDITGHIPEELIETCGSLRMLQLRSNRLSGLIPESIGNMQCLQHLDLSDNRLNGSIPKYLGSMRSLEYLDLSDNLLDGSIPPSIGMLRSLKNLMLRNNYLNGQIPNSLGQLQLLLDLDLSNNKLNGSIPESLWQLHLLSRLDLSGNSLHGIVTELHLSDLSKLEHLYLSGNSLKLKVPLEWVPPFSLLDLSLSSCIPGQEFPQWIRRQEQLEYLSMADSCISGALPQWIWNFSSDLSYLYLSNNMFVGAIPGPIANTSLRNVDLSSNKLQGSFPWLSNNTGLENLNLSNNSLSGHILLDGVSLLEKLDLSMNNISGTIPPSLCDAGWLATLYLSDNRLSGSLPDCICASVRDYGPDASILDMRLNNNHLSGAFPQFLQNCSSIVNLDLGNNRLSGEIPNWIAGSMAKLRILRLASNRFHGRIPTNMWNLTALRILDLSHNNLSGSIPSSFGSFAAMKTKPDSSNDEYDDIGFQYQVETDKKLILQMKGALLNYTTQLKHVRGMDLSENLLCGQIPPELGNLAGLQGLNLSNNHLSGNIPSTLGNISFLESLDLSKNKLSGGIPRALENLSFMGTFNVSCNNLSGTIPTKGQFHTFSNTSYLGNPGLCGPPLLKPCTSSSPQNPDTTTTNSGEFGMFWFLLGLAPGFVFGFWIFWGPFLLVTRWRHAYFRFLDDFCATIIFHTGQVISYPDYI